MMRQQFVIIPLFALPLFAAESFRPPAVPLVTHDPYFSIWSVADRLNEDNTRHWTGTEQPLCSLIRIDGKAYRLMGRDPRTIQPLEQKSLEVLPTRTIYNFEGGGVGVTLTFLTPALPRDLEALSRPVTYLTWRARATDGRQHDVAIYFDASPNLAVNSGDQRVTWSRVRLKNMTALRASSQQQPVLEKEGDNLRIDWGALYVAAPADENPAESLADRGAARDAFASGAALPEVDDTETDRQVDRLPVTLAIALPVGSVGSAPVSRHILIAYDDVWSLTYLERRVRAYWRRNGATAADLLEAAERDYSSFGERAAKFDVDLMADLRKTGGERYATMTALAYRQAFAAHKLAVDEDGALLFFPKENFSNGCIDTVDVFYPSSPLFLLLNPKLLEGSVAPVMEYAALPRWRFDFAPHDLGRYPHANGQVYGGGERTEENQMPVEESSNMIILTAAIAKAEGSTALARRYWPQLEKWAGYLKAKGLDPENQLSTDDFAGHLAHNANLSIKAIVALGAYAQLAGETGHKEEAEEYRKTATDFAKRWVQMAIDGDHYKLAFDKPGSWSQKYNLVWDRILGLKLFPQSIADTEIAFYKAHQSTYGLPLDNRSQYTKLDWIYWTATLANSQADFDALVEPTRKFANESPSRVPLTDWYWTQDAKQRGFQARSVVGGLYMKMLADAATWKRWANASY
jgi:hypothetical protein